MSGITKAAQMTCVWAATLMSLAVLAAQDMAAQDPAPHDPVLHIAVVSGEGAVHAPGEHVAKPVTVQVTDGLGRPVEGVRVSFQAPPVGPGGVFSSGLGTDLATTDANGRATVRSLQLNRIAGRFLIRVTAAKEQARAGIVLQQYINLPSSVHESASADRTAPPAVPEKALPAAASTNTPPPQPKSNPLEIAPATPLQPRKAKDPKALAAIQPSSAIHLAEGTVPPQPARIPTIILTQGSGKPVPGAMAGGGYTSRKSKSHKKWIWLGILAAGGVGGAFAGSSMSAAAVHNSASAAVTAPITIGAPTISIGKP